MTTLFGNDDTPGSGESQQSEALEATLSAILFHNTDTSFLVARFCDENGTMFTGTGEMFAPHKGDRYRLSGAWTRHPKYGMQFRWNAYDELLPTTPAGIEQYLASGLIKGIGKATARSIVRHFGPAALDVMNSEIDRLLEVEGIGERKLDSIKSSWETQRAVQGVMVFLKSHGISTAYAVRIYRTYGGDAVARVTADPYQMSEDVEGIGFLIADRIARQLGIGVDDPRRLRAGVSYVVRDAARSKGHTYLIWNECVEAASAMLGSGIENVEPALNACSGEGTVIVEDERVYPPELFAAEMVTSDRLVLHLRRPPVAVDYREQGDIIGRIERDLGIEFAPHQVEAISKCFSVPALLLTGGPGTGKTTAIAGILAIADARGWRTMLCAPTGRAAKRLSELSGHEARTIHRLLEFDPATWSFMRDDDNPIEADLVIVDEMSMVDIELMAALIRAVPLSAHLVMVGDPDQLPSVGPGNVLRDLLDSGCLESVALRQVFRQDETGSIVTNAHRVRNGEMPVFRRETVFIEAGSPESIVEHVREQARLQGSQVIAPMHHTLPGVRNLNAVLQRDLNGSGRVIFNKGDTVWRKGDKVMQTRNNYDKDVFNGDIGSILDGTTEDAELTIDFDGRAVRYSFDDMDDVMHAYAITVHKSQGSEYESVIMPLSLQHRIMLQRNLLYTAMTRARRRLVFIGQKQALALAVNNNKTATRRSYLCRRLTEAMR